MIHYITLTVLVVFPFFRKKKNSWAIRKSRAILKDVSKVNENESTFFLRSYHLLFTHLRNLLVPSSLFIPFIPYSCHLAFLTANYSSKNSWHFSFFFSFSLPFSFDYFCFCFEVWRAGEADRPKLALSIFILVPDHSIPLHWHPRPVRAP